MSLESQLSPAKIPKDANVLAVCMRSIKRSPILVEILKEHGYQNADCTGVDIPDLDEIKEKAAWADYIVTLDAMAATKLRGLGLITGQHALIEFDVRELVGNGSGNYRTLEEIKCEIKEKIAPYLEN